MAILTGVMVSVMLLFMDGARYSKFVERILKKFNLSKNLVHEYIDLFETNQIPICTKNVFTKMADRVVMISTHGYWGDPPPAGVPDTGGQTYYVLEISKAWGAQGRKVIIIARWFEPYPRVERIAKNVWLVRIHVGGNQFIRKEDIYTLVPQMAEASVAISAIFGAKAVMGHYADGMVSSIEVGERLKIPAIVIPHSMGIRKLINLGFEPNNPDAWFDKQYNFWTREEFEISSLKGSNLEIANTPAEPKVLNRFYGLDFPNIVMPAGAGKYYFDAFKIKQRSILLQKYNIQPKKFILFFGRLSEAKNIPACVSVIGEAKKLDPKMFNDMKLLIVGGDPENPQKEEAHVEQQIRLETKKYNLTENDVLRIPSQDWNDLSILVRDAFLYLGMQMMEPFGMAAAEAMAVGVPIFISKFAGISRWLEHGKNSIIIDPENPKEVASTIISFLRKKFELKSIALHGRKFAREHFSWSGIARRQGQLIDDLYHSRCPHIDNPNGFTQFFLKREGRAYHRLAFAWRGDPPIIKEKHKRACHSILDYIFNAQKMEQKQGRRLIVCIGGESGSGKSEIAEYLRFAIRAKGLRGATIPGDAFFKKTPQDNHNARIRALESGNLVKYLGPQEVDLARLEEILKQARDTRTEEVMIPSDCRTLNSRRYDNVPLSLKNIDVIFVDLTYSLLLKNTSFKIFLESDYKKRIDEVRERNLARDPDQDFNFILKVLEIEHSIIQKLKNNATHIVDTNYEVVKI